MCLSCACGEPNENHGDNRHITLNMLEEAAKAGEISPLEAAKNILESYEKVETPAVTISGSEGENPPEKVGDKPEPADYLH